ncbi:hypothetical protein HMPREF2991_06430 [Streptococcus sp. HMSC072D07]|uniref:hypothetical protein n=1 Tax=Streptococcus sp. HMSC072D07 TaxID=1739495 RepID=UPI0008A50143|nr:hypothetical protein [Streptococcus sp. HMSC072D07]OFP33871.1 hypothetical protein HMPREF2991_06430 [Streptococcus sp. HMSC072D07]
MDIFDVYNFQNQVENVNKKGNLKESLKLLDIVYFDGSLEKGNEDRIVFEFSKTRTMAIEVRIMEKKIRFWGWIGKRQKGDYFWKYVFENYKELWYRILSLLMSEYFSPTECISCEIVSTVNRDLLCHWEEGTEDTEDTEDKTLYVGRLLLFGFVPLWKVKHTKHEWEKIALIESSQNKIVKYQFEEDVK